MLELSFYNSLWLTAYQSQMEQNTKKGLGKFHMLKRKPPKPQDKFLTFLRGSCRWVSAGSGPQAASRTSLSEMVQLFQRCVQPLEISYSATKLKTPCGLGQISLITFAKAQWQSFAELNLPGNIIVLLEEEKNLELIK